MSVPFSGTVFQVCSPLNKQTNQEHQFHSANGLTGVKHLRIHRDSGGKYTPQCQCHSSMVLGGCYRILSLVCLVGSIDVGGLYAS